MFIIAYSTVATSDGAKWLKEIHSHPKFNGNTPPIILAGTKCDLQTPDFEKPWVPTEKQMSTGLVAHCLDCSAKTMKGVKELYQCILQEGNTERAKDKDKDKEKGQGRGQRDSQQYTHLATSGLHAPSPVTMFPVVFLLALPIPIGYYLAPE
eukprot:COSAG06_NODE_6348_length_2974_cov_2.264000_1_plen_151_part_10